MRCVNLQGTDFFRMFVANINEKHISIYEKE